MDGGVGGSWEVREEDIECAIDENVVECSEMDSPPFTGIPAPAYLSEDPWFAPPCFMRKAGGLYGTRNRNETTGRKLFCRT